MRMRIQLLHRKFRYSVNIESCIAPSDVTYTDVLISFLKAHSLSLLQECLNDLCDFLEMEFPDLEHQET